VILCGDRGLTGIFIAIPVVAILTVAFQNYRAHRTIAVVTGLTGGRAFRKICLNGVSIGAKMMEVNMCIA
jgi:hypothetical protein